MHALGLLIGMVQAYICAKLAMVYIASATQAHEHEKPSFTDEAENKVLIERKG
jgi:F-type H+-transporting ATPase subunit a